MNQTDEFDLKFVVSITIVGLLPVILLIAIIYVGLTTGRMLEPVALSTVVFLALAGGAATIMGLSHIVDYYKCNKKQGIKT